MSIDLLYNQKYAAGNIVQAPPIHISLNTDRTMPVQSSIQPAAVNVKAPLNIDQYIPSKDPEEWRYSKDSPLQRIPEFEDWMSSEENLGLPANGLNNYEVEQEVGDRESGQLNTRLPALDLHSISRRRVLG